MKIVRAVFDETKSLTVRSEILLYMGLGTECQRLIEFIRRLVRRHPKQEDVVKSVFGKFDIDRSADKFAHCGNRALRRHLSEMSQA